MTEYGIWSDTEAGFIETGYSSYQAALDGLIYLADRDDLDKDDLSAREICPEHPDQEQPKEGCEICDADDDD